MIICCLAVRSIITRSIITRKVNYPNEVQSIIIFKTKNLKQTMDELTSKGVKFVYPEAIEFPAGLFNAFKDPFGNYHEIVQLK